MPDCLIRATAADGRIRAVVAITTEMAEEARRRHNTYPTATAALGKALTGGLLMSSVLQKDGERMTIRILGGGPIGGIVVDASHEGRVRGYVATPDLDLPPKDGHLDVGGAVGNTGYLTVTHDSGLGHPYTGMVEMASGELGDDFTRYLAESVQTPSAVSLGIHLNREGEVDAAGGMIIQLLPGAGDEIAWRLEQTVEQLPSFSELIRRFETPAEILRAALEGFAIEVLVDNQQVAFSCECSEEKALWAISTLGKDEIRAMIEEDGKGQVRCHFCNNEYNFDKTQLEGMLN